MSRRGRHHVRRVSLRPVPTGVGEHVEAESPPVPGRVFRLPAEAGAESILSAHLSSALSGPYDAARLAAAGCRFPSKWWTAEASRWVSASVALNAATRSTPVWILADAADGVRRSAADSRQVLFYVDTLESLRRGGRIGKALGMAQRPGGSPCSMWSMGRWHRWRRPGRPTARSARLAELAWPPPMGVMYRSRCSTCRRHSVRRRWRTGCAQLHTDVVVCEVGAVMGCTSVRVWWRSLWRRRGPRDLRPVAIAVGIPDRFDQPGGDHCADPRGGLPLGGFRNPVRPTSDACDGAQDRGSLGVLDVLEGFLCPRWVSACGPATSRSPRSRVSGSGRAITSPFLEGSGRGKGGDVRGDPRHRADLVGPSAGGVRCRLQTQSPGDRQRVGGLDPHFLRR